MRDRISSLHMVDTKGKICILWKRRPQRTVSQIHYINMCGNQDRQIYIAVN